MHRVRFFSRNVTDSDTAQPAGSAAVPSPRDTREGARPPEQADYSRAEGRGTAGPGYPPAQAGYGQAEGGRARAETYGGAPESHRLDAQRRPYYGMAGTLMVLSGMLTFFIGIVGLINGIFFNRVATFPFYYSVRSRGVTFIVLGAIAFAVGLALLVHMYWARTVATVVAVVTAVANFMFLPFYPFWSVIVLALNVVIIWELMQERGRREYARLRPLPT
jgi:hypothetical protein